MLKFLLRKFFAKQFYPTNSRNWYKSKKYKGQNAAELFDNFLSSQKNPQALFYKEFQSLKLTRQYINSGAQTLDSVLIVPNKEISQNKPGEGLYFIMFQGRGEYYESRFRDMALQAKETGASVLGFNPKGMNSSTGNTTKLLDLVDDGIAVVRFLLDSGVKHDKIILQGNSLGAAYQEMVDQHYIKITGNRFRQINSNSFSTISDVLIYRYKPILILPFIIQLIKKLFDIILKYGDWEISLAPSFYSTGPYRCHLRRKNDRTIMLEAEYHFALDFEKDNKNCPKHYRASHRWLYENSQIFCNDSSKKDPHILGLNSFYIQESETRQIISVYALINYYISQSSIDI